MLKNYFLIALRNLRRHKLYSFINIVGLTVGMASGLLILLFVWHEWSHDRFHENADRIYRLVTVTHRDGQITHSAYTPLPMIGAIEQLPGVAGAAQVSGVGSRVVRYGDRQFREEGTGAADSGIFEIFDLTLLRGNPATALTEPFTAVINEELAEKYFGADDPMGRTLTINQEDYSVTGILAPSPANSELHFRLLTSVSSASAAFPWALERWIAYYPLYVLLAEGVAPGEFETRLNDLLASLRPDNTNPAYELHLLPLKDMYLRAEHISGIGRRGDRRTLYVFSSIALLIFLVACINYVNLATARSSIRAREVGVRKATGARRGQLMWQFLGESMLMSSCALLLALALVTLLLPAFSTLVERELAVDYLGSTATLAGLAGIVLVVGMLAGSYPAFFLSSLNPVDVLKGKAAGAGRHARLRKGMVVAQFVLSIALITGAWTVHTQLGYMRGKDPGFDREHIVNILLTDMSMKAQYDALKHELLQHTDVRGVAGTFDRLGRQLPQTAYQPEGMTGDELPQIRWLGVDHDFPDVFEIEVVEGRAFSADRPTDATDAFLLNKTAVRTLGWDDPLGRNVRLRLNNREGVVIGIVQDFHYASMRDPIEPMILYIQDPVMFSTLSVRVAPDQLSEALDHLRKVWHAFAPEIPFEYTFLDEDLAGLYQQEARLARIFAIFALLAILIACLGLFGLAAYTAEQRTKEIGIRKVLGATVASVVTLLSKDFATLVLIATVISSPIGYYVMSRWLEDFAYRIEISWWIFALAGGIALAIALLTVSSQAVKAAVRNPVEALRYE